jgi:glycosyltransferase involved in cell wall biosynthesis
VVGLQNNSRRARVVHIITGLSTGGAERALYNVIANGLADSYSTVVVSLTDEGRYGPMLKELGVAVYCLGMKRGIPSVSSLVKFRTIIKELNPDLIQGWMYHGNLFASFASLFVKPKRRIVWNVRQCIYSLNAEKRLTRSVILLGARLSACADGIIYNSQLSCTHHRSIGYSNKKDVVIPNGFPLSRFAFNNDSRTKIRDGLALSLNDFVVGHVGRFHPMKDHANFLKAAVLVAKKLSNARFLMIGTDIESSNAELLLDLPKSLEDRFVLLGERSDVETYYSAMDAFCLSSSSEAFPNVLGEAMACGLPCISTNVGDAVYIVGDTGLIVPPCDPQALANAMLVMLEKPEEERECLRKEARARIEQHFSMDRVVDEYKHLYVRLIADN